MSSYPRFCCGAQHLCGTARLTTLYQPHLCWRPVPAVLATRNPARPPLLGLLCSPSDRELCLVQHEWVARLGSNDIGAVAVCPAPTTVQLGDPCDPGCGDGQCTGGFSCNATMNGTATCCFPSDAFITLLEGGEAVERRMEELRIGDQVSSCNQYTSRKICQ